MQVNLRISKMEDIQVAFLPAAVDACALYRMFLPHLNLKNSRFLFRMGPLNTQELNGCQVCVVQRQVSEHNLLAMKRMKEIGMKVIYDLDDDIWNLPPWNPGKATFDAMQEGFKMCAAEADMITVSTQGLLKATHNGFKLNKEIMIIPNAVDFNLFRPKNLVKDDTIVIGWQGSNTHSEDCKDVFDIIPGILDSYPNVRMDVCGAPAVEFVDEWENTVVDGRAMRTKKKMQVVSRLGLHMSSRFRRWVPVGEYANRLSSWGWDISLAPLAEHKFNRSKSNIRMLEAAALKIPCLASNIQPYNEFASLGGQDLKWLLCDFPSQWKTKLTTLINEPYHREALGNKMYEVAQKYYNAAVIKDTWNYAFNKVLSC
jgi:O-antigen biosynthesis protein